MNKYRNKTGPQNTVDSCGTSKKTLKQQLKNLMVVIEDIELMMEAGYIDYSVQDRLVGNLEIRRRDYEKQLANIAKK